MNDGTSERALKQADLADLRFLPLCLQYSGDHRPQIDSGAWDKKAL